MKKTDEIHCYYAKDHGEMPSEKVRKILGDMPRGVVRWGICVLFVVFVAMIAAVVCMDYPYGDGESIFSHVYHHQ